MAKKNVQEYNEECLMYADRYDDEELVEGYCIMLNNCREHKYTCHQKALSEFEKVRPKDFKLIMTYAEYFLRSPIRPYFLEDLCRDLRKNGGIVGALLPYTQINLYSINFYRNQLKEFDSFVNRDKLIQTYSNCLISGNA